MLCERGIRTFEAHTRFTLPLATVPYLHAKTHLPVVVDPSHGTGHTPLVPAMARAAIAAGADGLIVEVHPNPEKAMSDGYQSLTSGPVREHDGRLPQSRRGDGDECTPLPRTQRIEPEHSGRCAWQSSSAEIYSRHRRS